MSKVEFKKKSFPLGTIRNYGSYGSYIKKEDGWKRVKQGPSSFRKSLNYLIIRKFLLTKEYDETFLNKNGVKTLRSILKSKDLHEEFILWLGENNG